MNTLTDIIKNYIRNEAIELHNTIRFKIFKIIENEKDKWTDIKYISVLKELEKYYNNIVNKLIELI